MKAISNIIVMCTVPILGIGAIKGTEHNNGLPSGITYELADALAGNQVMENEKIVEELISEYEKDYKYTNTYVNFRMQPNTDSEIIETVKANTLVEHIEISSGWSYIIIGETYGYIKSDYLSDTETPVSELNRWGIDLTADEIDLLAKIVWTEARGEKQGGKEAVVEVVFNRIISGQYGDDLNSVLGSKGQFTSWSSRNSAKPTENEYKAIDNVLYGNTTILGDDYVYFSTGKSYGKDFVKIGNHWFGRK